MKYKELPLRKRIFKLEFWKPKTKADWFSIGFTLGFIFGFVWLYLMVIFS